jgi:hypothetical protein
MSWSRFIFRGYSADAHDSQQDTFMALAAMYVEANPAYRQIGWLRDWQSFWIEAAGCQGNGCSSLEPEEYLTDDERIELFRAFLRDYRSWVSSTAASAQLITGISADRLVTFTETMEAVVTRDASHPKVRWPLEDIGDQTFAGSP